MTGLNTVIDYLAVLLLGLLVGLVELASRYRDKPTAAIFCFPGTVYLGINAVAACLALFLLRLYGVDFGFDNSSNQDDSSKTIAALPLRVSQILAAGLGASVVFRTAVVNLRMGEQDVPVGPAAILQSILAIVDRAVDRKRALERNRIVERLAAGISFTKSADTLTPHCLGLMQNVSAEDQASLATQVAQINASSGNDQAQMRLLILTLLTLVGEEVLESSIESLKKEIKV